MYFLKLLLLLSFLASSLPASNTIKIFILHSYSQEYKWTKLQHNAFVTTLSTDNNKHEFYTEYLDTKRINPTHTYHTQFISYLNNKYEQEDIDIIYVTDDNALNFIYQNYQQLFTSSSKKPVVFFSGVNNLNMQVRLPKNTFKGVYEVKEIKENIELIKQFSPQTRDIYFVGDNSQTYKSIKKIILEEENSFQNMNFHYIDDINISGILEKLPTKARSFVVLTTIGQLKDENNKTLLVQESIKKMKDNKNIILLSMEDAYMYEGVVGGYVTNGAFQGREAAKLVLEYLRTNSLDGISSIEKSPNSYTFNSRELVNARIILSEYIARDAILIGKNKNFDKNHSTVVSVLSLAVVGLLFFLTLMYIFFTKKNAQQQQSDLQKDYDNLKQKLNMKDQFINNIMSFGNIAYWRLDTDKDKLYLSTNLLKQLSIDDNIYQNDPEALSYFIHENDKPLFQSQLQQVKESKKSVSFEHKMVSVDKQNFDVKHIIYTQYINKEASALIYGIIEFERQQ